LKVFGQIFLVPTKVFDTIFGAKNTKTHKKTLHPKQEFSVQKSKKRLNTNKTAPKQANKAP